MSDEKDRRLISIVDLVIDKPQQMPMADVRDFLEKSSVNGHDILYVQVSVSLPQDIVDIPHPGHSVRCYTDGLMRKTTQECITSTLQTTKIYERHFNVRLVMDGAVYFGDWEHFNYKYRDALIMFTCCHVAGLAITPTGKRHELQLF